MSKILVTGSSNGLGKAIVDALHENINHLVFGYDIRNGRDVCNPCREVIEELALIGGIDCLINCAGVNAIGWLDEFSERSWDEVMDVNAKGIFMMSKAFFPQLSKNWGTIVNIVSNASHMPMTCSGAYNASKAAAHILTQQLAHELTPKNGITVFGISPNKLKGTLMSRHIENRVCETRGWTKEFSERYQKKALLTGEETDPKAVAEFLAFLLQDKAHHKYLSGCILPYGA